MTSNQLIHCLIKAPKSKFEYVLELNKHRNLSIHWSSKSNTIFLSLENFKSVYPAMYDFIIYPPTKDSGKIVALLRIKYPNFFNTYSRLKSYIKEDKTNGK